LGEKRKHVNFLFQGYFSEMELAFAYLLINQKLLMLKPTFWWYSFQIRSEYVLTQHKAHQPKVIFHSFPKCSQEFSSHQVFGKDVENVH